MGYAEPSFINAVISRMIEAVGSAVGSTGVGAAECGVDLVMPSREGEVLGVVRRPSGGWGVESAQQLNALIRLLAAREDWRHVVVRMHPGTWSRIMPYLDYNLSFPKPGVPMDMDGGLHEDASTIEVVWREVVRHPY